MKTSKRNNADLAGHLHHVEINVSNVARSRDFWGWLLADLGYSLFQEWPEGVSFSLGPTYLVFVQTAPEHRSPPFHRRKAGLNHIAFYARSRRHINDLAKELMQRGVPLLYHDRFPNAGGPDHYAIFFEDPDRIKVEVVSPE